MRELIIENTTTSEEFKKEVNELMMSYGYYPPFAFAVGQKSFDDLLRFNGRQGNFDPIKNRRVMDIMKERGR